MWEEELRHDRDRKYLLDGIRHGFRLIPENIAVDKVEVRNHQSAKQHKDGVEKELLDQISKGHYIVTNTKPDIVSALAAIPKDDGDIRVIHDASRPRGAAMNDYVSADPVQFQTLEEACRLAKPGYWCAKVDLKSAYRSVAIHPDNYSVTGLKWKFHNDTHSTYMFDTRLPFGSCLGPSIFHRLSQAVRRCMARKGYKDVVVYIDDFLIVAPTYDTCNAALHCLIRLLRKLGFLISWKKVVGPTQKITFLGVDIDTRASTLSLGKDKLNKLEERLRQFQHRKRATKLQLQSIAGLLNWACQAVRGGKFFLRRILDLIAPLQQQSHKVRLTSGFKGDLSWWLTYLRVFNGTVFFNEQTNVRVHVDACNQAAGAFCQGDWLYTVFHCDLPAAEKLHINYKEVCAVFQAVKQWAPLWRGRTVIVQTDSTVTKGIINKGRSRNAFVNRLLRQMFWICAKHDCVVRAISVSGSINIVADTVSRLHERDNIAKLFVLLSNWWHGKGGEIFDLTKHMSTKALLCLSNRRVKWSQG